MAYQPPPIAELTQIAEILVKSGFYRNTVSNTDQALAKMLYGMELGLTPVQCMTAVYVMKNKEGVILSQPTLTAPAMSCLMQKGGYKLKTKQFDGKKSIIEVIDKDGTLKREAVFSWEDAQRAQLTGNMMYNKYPQNMLYSRNIANIARQDCSDIFGGPVYTPEEMGAEVDEEGMPVEDDGSFRLTMRESANEELRLRGEPPMPPKEQKQKAADKPKPEAKAESKPAPKPAETASEKSDGASAGPVTNAENPETTANGATNAPQSSSAPSTDKPGADALGQILQAGGNRSWDKTKTNKFLCDWLTANQFDLKTFRDEWTNETVEAIKQAIKEAA
ncbi:MAG: hypothetical protein K2W95_01045 [Candidatus Obscuribacterales bacterium]|nr:hypothetical protein [Candidatus Obscuribacterales bacterium]